MEPFRLALAVAIALAPPAARADEPPLTLAAAVKLALARNERARISQLDVEVAQAGVMRARSRFLPVLNLNANDTLKPEQLGSPGLSANSATATLSLQQPLLDLGAFPLLSQAKESLAAQQDQSAEDLRTLAFDAARAFFDVLTAKAVLEAGQRRVDSAQAALADAQARVEAGLAGTNDVTRAQVDLASAAQQLQADLGSVGNAGLALGFIIDEPPPAALSAPNDLLQVAQKPLGGIEPLVASALARRLDLSSLRHAAIAARESAREPLLRIAPTLGFTGSAQATTAETPSGHALDSTLAITLTWALYDAGQRYADLRQRDASAEIANLQALALARSIQAEVLSASDSLHATQAAYAVAEQGVAVAHKNAQETAALYKQGLAKAIELIDANDQLYLAEVGDAQARYAMAEAYLELRSALGLQPVGLELQ